MTAIPEIIISSKYAHVSISEEGNVLICELQHSYVPEDEFRALFTQIGEWIKLRAIDKMIFDKRSLKVFHQPSMTWYHTQWKAEMRELGLHTYRKLLPADVLFRKSVEIGRDKIAREHPEFNFADYDIRYCESLEEALEA